MSEVMGFMVRSDSDPNKKGLLYYAIEQARHHKDMMNDMIPRYDDPNDTKWNKDYWKTKPTPFKIFTLVVDSEID